MTWDERISVFQKWIDLLIRAEIHAFVLIFTGAVLYLHGAKELGTGAFSAGLGIFRGNRP